MYSLILHGRRFVELKKLGNLRFAVSNSSQNASAFCSSFSSATDESLQDARKGKNFTVSYLVASLGLATISTKISSEEKGNPDSVLNLFRSHGFTDSQICDIVRAYPRVLIADAEKSLAPKLQFLQSRGASTPELTEILSKVPKILGLRWQKATGRYYDFVKDIIEADKSSEYEMSCLSLPQGSAQDNTIRNVLVLRELGVPQRLLFSFLFSNFRSVSGKERFEESLKKVLEMGFDPTTGKFVQALCVVYQLSDKTIEEKVNLYKRLGFAVGDVWEIFKKYPTVLAFSEKKILNSIEKFIGLGFTTDECLMMTKRFPHCIGYSAESVKKKTEFLVKKMNWSLRTVASNPAVFGYSLEKRTVPRCNVIKALMSKGLMASKLPPMSNVLAITDQAFLNKYVLKHDDKKLVAELMAIFTGVRVS